MGIQRHARSASLLTEMIQPCYRWSAMVCCQRISMANKKPKTDTAIPIVERRMMEVVTEHVRCSKYLGLRPSSGVQLQSLRLRFAAQLPVASFDSVFPCAPTSRDCLPQPGITNPAQYLDILSYRQRPTWRLAYRNFGTYEALVTNQSVEALAGIAGVRWYELRRTGDAHTRSINRVPMLLNDGVHRWMGSIAQDSAGISPLATAWSMGWTFSREFATLPVSVVIRWVR